MKKNTPNTLAIIIWISVSALIGLWVWNLVSGNGSSLKMYLVQSGSMEPSIMVGDVIVVSKTNDYSVNDVITFLDDDNKRVTHRIIEKRTGLKTDEFLTKGDANRSGDREAVFFSSIVGEVVMTIPKLGYLINFLKTKIGFVLLVILPGLLIVVSEISVLLKSK